MVKRTTKSQKKMREKNLALLAALVFLALLFYGLAIVRLKIGH